MKGYTKGGLDDDRDPLSAEDSAGTCDACDNRFNLCAGCVPRSFQECSVHRIFAVHVPCAAAVPLRELAKRLHHGGHCVGCKPLRAPMDR